MKRAGTIVELKLLVFNVLGNKDVLSGFEDEPYYQCVFLKEYWQNGISNNAIRRLGLIDHAFSILARLSDLPHTDFLNGYDLSLGVHQGDVQRATTHPEELPRIPPWYTMEALGHDQLRVFQLLLSYMESEPSRKTSEASNPTLQTAARRGELEAVQSIMESVAISDGSGYDPPLVSAASIGQLHIVRCLHELGADINGIRPFQSPLHAAATHQYIEIVGYLLGYGAVPHPSEIPDVFLSIRGFGSPILAQRFWANLENNFSGIDKVGTGCLPEATERSTRSEALHKNFYENHLMFILRSRNSSPPLVNFANSMLSYKHVWALGIETIKQILRNQVPDNTSRILSCLQCAWAMNYAAHVEVWIDKMRDYESQSQYGILETFEQSRQEFLQDLARWRAFVPNEGKGVFDEAVQIMWGEYMMSYPPSSGGENVDDNMYYFKQLLENLISAAGWPPPSTDEDADGETLPELHFRKGIEPESQTDAHRHASELHSANVWRKQRLKIELLETESDMDVRLVILLAGAIFAAIVTFLIVWHSGIDALAQLASPPPNAEGNGTTAGTVERNCRLLLLFFGLERRVLPRWDLDRGWCFEDDHTEIPKDTCPGCHKVFRPFGKLNSHWRYDCAKGPRIRSVCNNQGCTKSYARNCELQKHLRSCPFGRGI